MDLRKIKKLIELVEESGIAELEVKSGEESVRISMLGAAHGQGTAVGHTAPTVVTTTPELSEELAAEQDTGSSASAARALASGSATGKPLPSPLSGTFYVASSPSADAFVAVGDRVAVGDVLCIVESMKMMNRIESDRAGVVAAVLVENGEPVESGQPLFLIDS